MVDTIYGVDDRSMHHQEYIRRFEMKGYFSIFLSNALVEVSEEEKESNYYCLDVQPLLKGEYLMILLVSL